VERKRLTKWKPQTAAVTAPVNPPAAPAGRQRVASCDALTFRRHSERPEAAPRTTATNRPFTAESTSASRGPDSREMAPATAPSWALPRSFTQPVAPFSAGRLPTRMLVSAGSAAHGPADDALPVARREWMQSLPVPNGFASQAARGVRLTQPEQRASARDTLSSIAQELGIFETRTLPGAPFRVPGAVWRVGVRTAPRFV
jgi:hypothetical protein